MFFRNLFLFRFGEGVIASPDAFERAIAAHPLREVGPLELATNGFVSPLGRGDDAFALIQERAALFAVGTYEKLLPGAVVAEELAHRIAQLVDREGRRPGAKERKRMKEAIVDEFLPRAFVRYSRTLAYIDLDGGWLVIDTSSRRAAEDVVSRIREALGRFPCTPLAPEESPRNLMTGWLIDATMPKGFVLGEECELRDPAEAGAIVRCRRQDLESDEVREHLRSGKQVFQLGAVFDDRVSFVLGEDLVVRKLRFLDVVLDQLGDGVAESVRAEVDATFALMRLELRAMLARLVELFKLPAPGKEKLTLDGGDAPKAMREAARAAGKLDAMCREDGMTVTVSTESGEVLATFGATDDPYERAVALVRETRRASIASIQRHLRIGYNAAARLIDRMEKAGVVSPPQPNGARTVL
jgi:recombination associated protein RdgC